jgi:hypothetical protein
VLVLGDSLSAAHNIPADAGWVSLQQRVRQQSKTPRIVNASMSGETTAGALTRLPALLAKEKPTVVVIALAATTHCGLTLCGCRATWRKMVQASQKARAKVLLLGIDVPPNYGRPIASAWRRPTRRWPRSTRCRCCRSCWRGGPAAGHDAGRRPAPDRTGAAKGAGQRLAAAQAAALNRLFTSDGTSHRVHRRSGMFHKAEVRGNHMRQTKETSGLVLVVEDNRNISEMIGEYLEGRGFEVDYAQDGLDGYRLAAENSYDVVVLDLMLPRLDGIEGAVACATMRASPPRC